MRYRISPAELPPVASPAPGWLRQQLPDSLGECYSDRFELGSDLAIVHSRYRPTRDVVEQSTLQNTARTLVLTFGIEGESGYVGKDGGTLTFCRDHTTVSSFRNSVGARYFKADSAVTQLRLIVGEHALIHYLGEKRVDQLLGGESFRQLAFGKTSPSSLSHAAALIRSAASHSCDILGMHIDALNLISEQRLLTVSAKAETIRLSERDIKKLERVKSIMQTQMDQPLSINYLCAAVGLNESKLKEGFRYRFKTSPARMLMELRMRKALLLLESGSQVAEAAYQVGYQHPSNFSTAFSRFFGWSPKSVFGSAVIR
jgi:AraC family transcriptional activator of pyochelin receptor